MAHSVSLSWQEAEAVDGYNVYKGTAPGAEGASPINGGSLVTSATFIDSSVNEGDTLYYFVTAVKNSLESLHSNEVKAVLLPSAPTNLVAAVS